MPQFSLRIASVFVSALRKHSVTEFQEVTSIFRLFDFFMFCRHTVKEYTHFSLIGATYSEFQVSSDDI